jgi:hypothetical protein
MVAPKYYAVWPTQYVHVYTQMRSTHVKDEPGCRFAALYLAARQAGSAACSAVPNRAQFRLQAWQSAELHDLLYALDERAPGARNQAQSVSMKRES